MWAMKKPQFIYSRICYIYTLSISYKPYFKPHNKYILMSVYFIALDIMYSFIFSKMLCFHRKTVGLAICDPLFNFSQHRYACAPHWDNDLCTIYSLRTYVFRTCHLFISLSTSRYDLFFIVPTESFLRRAASLDVFKISK